ncbi:hypothetical protein [Rhodococcus sp. B10]|uniref:hypothetical protein n=1 Tax=Rhodococcus sp. B10 TaxID=2695876 RepID=UPI003211CB66
MFVQLVFRMDQASWNASHVAAFEYFGGVPARLVCDNLKAGTSRSLRPDDQPRLSRAGELLRHPHRSRPAP